MYKWILGFLILITGIVEASHGDRSSPYLRCTEKCTKNLDCPTNFGEFGWVRGACFWCRYDCMWNTVDIFERQAGFVPQFHGKWPFTAVSVPDFGLNFGLVVQEPASMIFSLMNLLTVFLMMRRLKKMEKIENRVMWMVYAHAGLICWISSTLFHMFDCDVTEKLDYFSAFAFILSAFWVSAIFTKPELSLTLNGRRIKKLLALTLVGFYVHHVLSMINHFDYSYNMTVCMTVAVLTSFLYVAYLRKRYNQNGQFLQSDMLLIRLLIWANLATTLEILDFVPVLWVIDSHSLFHFFTIPIPLWWAQFLEQTQKEHGVENDVLLHKIA